MGDNDERERSPRPTPEWIEKGQRGPNVPIRNWVPTTTLPVSAVPPPPDSSDKK